MSESKKTALIVARSRNLGNMIAQIIEQRHDPSLENGTPSPWQVSVAAPATEFWRMLFHIRSTTDELPDVVIIVARPFIAGGIGKWVATTIEAALDLNAKQRVVVVTQEGNARGITSACNAELMSRTKGDGRLIIHGVGGSTDLVAHFLREGSIL